VLSDHSGPTIRLAAENTPEAAAWAAFDTAALDLQALYAEAGREADAAVPTRRKRMEKAMEVNRLWAAWRELFLATDEPRPVA
jgi:hypothetical protein